MIKKMSPALRAALKAEGFDVEGDPQFICGLIGKDRFIATIHGKGQQRWTTKSGFKIEITPPK